MQRAAYIISSIVTSSGYYIRTQLKLTMGEGVSELGQKGIFLEKEL